MKIALFHDYLNQYGGAERVLETLCEMFPQAPIYTLFYDPEGTKNRFSGKNVNARINLRLVSRKHRWFIPLMPLWSDSFRIPDEYDLVISSSASYAKGFPAGQALHLSYCHTPLRYAWEKYEIPNFLTFHLKRWDYAAAQKPDVLIANSHFIAGKIGRYYGREAQVIYPPVDVSLFRPQKTKQSDYFLMVGRLLNYKLFDLGIAACRLANVPLKIIGSGPEYSRLKRAAGQSKTEFLGQVDDAALVNALNEAKALLFPQIEDFGLAAAEAQACGLPVVAYGKGGAKEIITADETGLFFWKQTASSLAEAIKKFIALDQDQTFKREAVSAAAESRFSKERFISQFQRLIDGVICTAQDEIHW